MLNLIAIEEQARLKEEAAKHRSGSNGKARNINPSAEVFSATSSSVIPSPSPTSTSSSPPSSLLQSLKTDEENEQCDSFVHRVFGGRLSSTVQCHTCGYSSSINEGFLDISLPIGDSSHEDDLMGMMSFRRGKKRKHPKPVEKNSTPDGELTLQQSLASFVAVEELSGENQYFCEGCAKRKKKDENNSKRASRCSDVRVETSEEGQNDGLLSSMDLNSDVNHSSATETESSTKEDSLSEEDVVADCSNSSGDPDVASEKIDITGCYSDASKRILIRDPPMVLVLVLKRFCGT